MTHALAATLRQLADDADAGRLPAELVARLERVCACSALRRRQRDAHIRAAATLLGGDVQRLQRLLGDDWRYRLWQRKHGGPSPAALAHEAAAYAAWEHGPLPTTARQLRNIVGNPWPFEFPSLTATVEPGPSQDDRPCRT